MIPVQFLPEAEADVASAFAWYELRQPGLGREFIADIDVCIARIRELPHACPIHRRNTRKALLHRFPFLLFYQPLNDRILVIACIHPSRNPDRWPK